MTLVLPLCMDECNSVMSLHCHPGRRWLEGAGLQDVFRVKAGGCRATL